MRSNNEYGETAPEKERCSHKVEACFREASKDSLPLGMDAETFYMNRIRLEEAYSKALSEKYMEDQQESIVASIADQKEQLQRQKTTLGVATKKLLKFQECILENLPEQSKREDLLYKPQDDVKETPGRGSPEVDEDPLDRFLAARRKSMMEDDVLAFKTMRRGSMPLLERRKSMEISALLEQRRYSLPPVMQVSDKMNNRQAIRSSFSKRTSMRESAGFHNTIEAETKRRLKRMNALVKSNRKVDKETMSHLTSPHDVTTLEDGTIVCSNRPARSTLELRHLDKQLLNREFISAKGYDDLMKASRYKSPVEAYVKELNSQNFKQLNSAMHQYESARYNFNIARIQRFISNLDLTQASG